MKILSLLFGFVFTISCFTPVDSIGQGNAFDSLSQALKTTTDPLKRSQLLNQLSFNQIPTDLEYALKLAEDALRYAKKSGNEHQIGWSLLNQGLCFQIRGDNNIAEKIFLDILELNQRLKDQSLEAYTINLQANQLRDQGSFDLAFIFYEKAKKLMVGKNDYDFEILSRLEQARYFMVLNKNDQAEKNIDEAISILNIHTSPAMLREAFLLKGNVLWQKFEYSDAETWLSRAESLSEKNSSSYLRIMHNRGEILFHQGDFPAAIEIWKSILDAEKKIGYKYDLANLLLNLAEAYSEQGYRKIANEYLSTCLDISARSGFQFIRSQALFEVAWIAYRNKNYSLAKKKIKEAEGPYNNESFPVWIAACNNLQGLIYMGRKMYDSSLYFHNLAYQVRLKEAKEIAISSSLFNIGELFVHRKEYQKALEFLWRGLKIDISINDQYGQSLYYYQLSRAHSGLNQLDSVKYYLEISIENAVPNSAYEVLQKSYLDMGALLQRTGKFQEAAQFLEKYIGISDSLYNKQTVQTLAAYETLFEVDKKEKEIELLNKDKELVTANSRIQTMILYTLLVSIVILIALVIFFVRMGVRLRFLNRSNEEKANELAKANKSLQSLYSDLQKNNNELRITLEKLKHAQDQLLRSEKMAALGVLAAGVAHELNNPLNYIKGGVTTLEIQSFHNQEIDQEKFKKSLKIIYEGIDRANEILKGLGQYSRQTENMYERCNLNKILDNCVVILSNALKFHVKIEKEFASEAPIIIGNEGKIHQAFINIISNAEQAIEGNGTIYLSTQIIEDNITVKIKDTGKGISKENLKRLGDLFFTTKEPGKGTGLGLSISYKIIEDHGGKILVESELDKGTTFTLTFPASK